MLTSYWQRGGLKVLRIKQWRTSESQSFEINLQAVCPKYPCSEKTQQSLKIQRIAHCFTEFNWLSGTVSLKERSDGSEEAMDPPLRCFDGSSWLSGTVSYDGGACSVGVNDPLSLMKVLCGYSALGESLFGRNGVEFVDHQKKVCFRCTFFQTLSHFFSFGSCSRFRAHS